MEELFALLLLLDAANSPHCGKGCGYKQAPGVESVQLFRSSTQSDMRSTGFTTLSCKRGLSFLKRFVPGADVMWGRKMLRMDFQTAPQEFYGRNFRQIGVIKGNWYSPALTLIPQPIIGGLMKKNLLGNQGAKYPRCAHFGWTKRRVPSRTQRSGQTLWVYFK